MNTIFVFVLTAAASTALFAQVGPTKETPGKFAQIGSTPPRFLSKWDNPVIQGSVLLHADQFEKRPDDDNWEYYKFDLWAATMGIVNNANTPETNVLDTWPLFQGFQFTAGQPFLWEMHGTRLGPRLSGRPGEAITTVQARRKDWNSAVLPDGSSGLVQLDPSVALTPVHVVSLFVPGSANFDIGWFPKAEADALLDDIWTSDKLTVTNPNESPHDVVASWKWSAECAPGCTIPQVITPTVNKHDVLPDRIFDQCNVQFREVSFDYCAVPEDVFFNEQTNTFQACMVPPTSQFSRIRNAVQKCFDQMTRPDKPSFADAITVIVAGSLFNSSLCGDLEVPIEAEKDGVIVATVEGLGSPTTVAHELGHALGLDHPLASGCADDNLMCAVAAAQPTQTHLNAVQCTKAHNSALFRQNSYLWK